MAVQDWSRIGLDFEYWNSKEDIMKMTRDATGRMNLGSEVNAWKNATNYVNQQQLQQYIANFENWLAKIDMGGMLKKQRLKITADERGVFSFSLASQGLIAPTEFFGDKLALELPDEFASQGLPSGIVPALYVDNIILNDTPLYYYNSKTNNKQYEVRPQHKGTRAIDLGLPDAELEYETLQKKSYVMFPKKGGKARMIDLYIPKNGGIHLANILPSLMVAHFMRLYGVMCRISVIRVWNSYTWTDPNLPLMNSAFGGYGFMIKDFGDEIDFNMMALQGVDDVSWNGVVACAGLLRGERIRNGFKYGGMKDANIDWTSAYDNTGGYPDDDNMPEFMARYRNFYTEKIEKGEINPIRLDKKLMMMGFTKDGSESGVMKKFWEILDTIDFQFNKTDEVCKRIYKRLVTDKNDLANEPTYIKEFKRYIIKLLQTSYLTPIGGYYAEKPESKEKMDREYNEKYEDVIKFLSN